MGYFKDRNCYMKDYNLSLIDKIRGFNYLYLFLVSLVVFIGIGVLYSVGNGHFSPWASKQSLRFVISLCFLLMIALTNLRLWMKYAYWIYGAGVALLVGVELFGHIGMGAQRWLNLGVFQLQPSEVMKIALVLALAKYFHGASLEQIRSVKFMIPPVLMMGIPVLLILKQPDLGTAMMLVFMSFGVFFLVGVQIWKFVLLALLGIGSFPVVWSLLHDYQKKRVLTFLNPESDPLGAGYHISQSKITLGSGGFWGKGFMQGTQTRLNFIPEKQTDFIFTVFAEEFGLFGSLILFALYTAIIGYGFLISARCQNFFGKILAAGLTINFALYLFINSGMVMGLMPVVGVPLPLMSYGGTAMITLFISFGLMECVDINREMIIGRLGSIDDE
ncbi:MAG: rod shape-determining protein RodA [Alphaproteobacteria bacterium]